MFLIGIDPGLSGAVGVLDSAGGLYALRDLPTTVIPGRGIVTRRLDGAALVKLFADVVPHDARALCYIEDVQVWAKPVAMSQPEGQAPKAITMGASTMAAMLGTKLVLMAILDCFRSRIELRTVQPMEWKRTLGLKRPKIPGKSASQIKTIAKAESRARAVALYPGADIRQAQHDGRAEALLIAHYGREVWKTENGLFEPPEVPPAPRKPTAKEIRDADIDSRVPL